MSATDQSHSPPPSVTREVWADLIALERPAAPAAPPRPATGKRAERIGLLVAPVALAWCALHLLPSQYASETSFMLRHQAAPLALPASGTDLGGVAGDNGTPDGYAVRDFLLSRDAMQASGTAFAGSSVDARYQDFSARVTVDYETSSGVITIRALAPSAAQARDLAQGLQTAASGLVKRFDHASGAAEYVAPLAAPSLPDAPTRQDQPLVLLGALALGLALSWSRKA